MWHKHFHHHQQYNWHWHWHHHYHIFQQFHLYHYIITVQTEAQRSADFINTIIIQSREKYKATAREWTIVEVHFNLKCWAIFHNKGFVGVYIYKYKYTTYTLYKYNIHRGEIQSCPVGLNMLWAATCPLLQTAFIIKSYICVTHSYIYKYKHTTNTYTHTHRGKINVGLNMLWAFTCPTLHDWWEPM